jgi:23S rRNA (cytosine1962-C5)-methyltransferase
MSKVTKWICPSFEQYELVDAGGGKKLERVGNLYTVRPETQAYFKSGMSFQDWDNYNPLIFQEDRGIKGKWLCPHTTWKIEVDGVSLNLETTKMKHIGVFPEQYVNWKFLSEHLNERKRFLNLFAYTGAASLIARQTGAEVVHVDSVKQLITWAKSNMLASNLSDIKWVLEDALKFAEREVKRGNKYNGIIMDPPAWGIGAKGEKWKIEEKLPTLIKLANDLLETNGFLVLNTYSPRVSLADLQSMAMNYFKTSEIELGELWSIANSGKELFHGYLLRVVKS